MDYQEFKDTIKNWRFPIIWGQLRESLKTAKDAEEDPTIKKGLANFIEMMPRSDYDRDFNRWIWMMDTGCDFDHLIGNLTEDGTHNGELLDDIVMDRFLTALDGIENPKYEEE